MQCYRKEGQRQKIQVNLNFNFFFLFSQILKILLCSLKQSLSELLDMNMCMVYIQLYASTVEGRWPFRFKHKIWITNKAHSKLNFALALFFWYIPSSTSLILKCALECKQSSLSINIYSRLFPSQNQHTPESCQTLCIQYTEETRTDNWISFNLVSLVSSKTVQQDSTNTTSIIIIFTWEGRLEDGWNQELQNGKRRFFKAFPFENSFVSGTGAT